MQNIKKQEDNKTIRTLLKDLFCEEVAATAKILPLVGGLTNYSFKAVTIEGNFTVRLPGVGTERLIDRASEKISTELASRLGVDTELLYFGQDGTKVARFIEGKTMSPQIMREEENIRQAAEVFRKLHSCGEDTGVYFDVFDMANCYEKFLRDNHVEPYKDENSVRRQVFSIKELQNSTSTVHKVPCHNDPLCENWIQGNRLYLIDWEYAGMNDAMWDLADLSIEAGYTQEQDRLLLRYYLGKAADLAIQKQFLANKIYVDYLWTLWGKTRIPFDGEPMVNYAQARYKRLKHWLKEYAEKEGIQR